MFNDYYICTYIYIYATYRERKTYIQSKILFIEMSGISVSDRRIYNVYKNKSKRIIYQQFINISMY